MDARLLLTINTGSSGLKAALYRLREDATETSELRAEVSRIGGRGGSMRLADDRGETLDERRDGLPDHAAALDARMSRLRDWGLDRDDLAAEALRHAGKTSRARLGDRAPTLISECEAVIARATAYSREHFEDPPEISNWTWTP